MDLEALKAVAAAEFARHGLRGWTFGLAGTRRRLGACKYATKRIEIAEYYARESPPETVLDTLRHEVAHALAGPAAGHGPAWKAVALRLGATPRACETSGAAVVEPGDWRATCPACGQAHHRYRRPTSPGGYRCRCAAGSPLTFAFMGDPARRPSTPLTDRDAARWEARCPGCDALHLRIRRPKAGLWSCYCAARSDLTWRPRQP